MFKPFDPAQLEELDQHFGAIHVHTPAGRAKSWAPSSLVESPYSLVFRACVPGEWNNITGQANDPKQKAGAPRNLAMATIVAVSVDGEHHIHRGEVGSPANDRAASKPPRDAFERLLSRPGSVGIPEAVADALAELNGVVADAAEKG